jgi:hypothetical protein
MNMPGFVAEAALYRTERRYRSVAPNAGAAASAEVVPAAPCCSSCSRLFRQCRTCLLAGGDWDTCWQCDLADSCWGYCSSGC